MLLPLLMSHLISPDLWGSWLILLEVWRPPRPSHLVYRCTIFVTLRDGLPLWPLSGSTTLRPLLALQFFLPKLCRSTRGRDLSVWWRGQFHSQNVLRRSLSSRKGTSQVTHVTRRCVAAILPASLRAFTSIWSCNCLQCRCFYTFWSLHHLWRWRQPGFPQTDYTHMSECGNTGVFPKRPPTQGTMVTYVTWDVLALYGQRE